MTNILIDETFQNLFEHITGEYLDSEDLIPTNETIDDYRSARENHWRERGTVRINSDTVFVVDDVQPQKGMRRGTVAVVDFGETRISSFA